MEYYISQGKTSGLCYELGGMMADSMGLKAVFHIYYTYEDAYIGLLEKKIDLLAAADHPNPEWNALFSYSEPLCYTDVIVVEPKKKHVVPDSLAKRQLAVSMPLMFMEQAAGYLMNHDSNMTIKYCTAVSDQLLQEVEEGRYDLTFALGLYWRAYSYLFPHLKMSETLLDSVPVSWVFRKNSDSLLYHCNQFIRKMITHKKYLQVLRKYTNPSSTERIYLASIQHLSPFGSISRYDEQLRKCAEKYHLDWYLLAALIYQESKFQTDAVGRGSTYGLMQFKPETASRYGVYSSASAEQQIEGGCRHLYTLRQILEKEGVLDSVEQIPMMIAAYNAGIGHLKDAISIAKSEGWNSAVWTDNVEKALLCLNERSYYHKDFIKSGRYRSGRHTIHYVQSILLRRERYQSLAERDALNEVM